MKTKEEVLEFIKKNDLAKGEAVICCLLYPNGFEFKTEKLGWKLYDFQGNDLIGELAKGERVLWCSLYPGGFGFGTEFQEWVEVKFKKDYTKVVTWAILLIMTSVIWKIIFDLITK